MKGTKKSGAAASSGDGDGDGSGDGPSGSGRVMKAGASGFAASVGIIGQERKLNRNRGVAGGMLMPAPRYDESHMKKRLMGVVGDRYLLYFGTWAGRSKLEATDKCYFINTDDEFVYQNFNSDFGPLNLGMVYRYAMKLNALFKERPLHQIEIIHYTTMDPRKRANAAFLIGAYSILYLKKTGEEAYGLLGPAEIPFAMFRDAAFGPSTFYLSLLDVFEGFYKAYQCKFFDFEDFDIEEYEYYGDIDNADLHWIVPEKFVAFSGPCTEETFCGYSAHEPARFFEYFRENNVTTVVRLNDKQYDAKSFQDAGFQHRHLFFKDGSCPPEPILNRFLEVSDYAEGAVAVHCKAGLGRTGTLIGCYLMKNFSFTAREAIAWTRICRPGSILGQQQRWLETREPLFKKLSSVDEPLEFRWPIYSANRKVAVAAESLDSFSPIVGLLAGWKMQDPAEDVDDTEIEGNTQDADKAQEEEGVETQGDMLNKIKALRKAEKPSSSVVVDNSKVEESKEEAEVQESKEEAKVEESKEEVEVEESKEEAVQSEQEDNPQKDTTVKKKRTRPGTRARARQKRAALLGLQCSTESCKKCGLMDPDKIWLHITLFALCYLLFFIVAYYFIL